MVINRVRDLFDRLHSSIPKIDFVFNPNRFLGILSLKSLVRVSIVPTLISAYLQSVYLILIMVLSRLYHSYLRIELFTLTHSLLLL